MSRRKKDKKWYLLICQCGKPKLTNQKTIKYCSTACQKREWNKSPLGRATRRLGYYRNKPECVSREYLRGERARLHQHMQRIRDGYDVGCFICNNHYHEIYHPIKGDQEYYIKACKIHGAELRVYALNLNSDVNYLNRPQFLSSCYLATSN